MTTAPAQGEPFHFYTEPLRVVFATPAVRSLYAAYGFDLWANALPSSGRVPEAGGDRLRVALADAAVLKARPPVTMVTTWEEAFQATLARPTLSDGAACQRPPRDRHAALAAGAADSLYAGDDDRPGRARPPSRSSAAPLPPRAMAVGQRWPPPLRARASTSAA